MRYLLYILLVSVAITSCTLSAKQEENLNNQLSAYISANNEGLVLEAVALSHPGVVKYYKSQGDSIFMAHFKHGLSEDEESGDFLEDPLYRDTKEKGKLLQRKYELKLYSATETINNHYVIFAISEDKGDNWFFVREEDYHNSQIKGFERLFPK